jgi:hypothetical protein
MFVVVDRRGLRNQIPEASHRHPDASSGRRDVMFM